MRRLPVLITLLSCIACVNTTAQTTDSLKIMSSGKDTLRTKIDWNITSIKHPFYWQMIIPALLTSYGFVALDNDHLLALDNDIKEEVWAEHAHKPVKIDDYLQYIPGISVYGLNAMGIKGKNNFRDRTMLYLLSSTMMAITVQSLKRIIRLPRPNGGGHNAFPSGHTSTAFVAAEFLYQEYKDRSPWYGIAGYAIATTVGYMRIYNNRHWFRDVVTGAGIGLGITKLVYQLYPKIKKLVFRNRSPHTLFIPRYQNNFGG